MHARVYMYTHILGYGRTPDIFSPILWYAANYVLLNPIGA